MLQGRRLHDWSQTAELLALLANVNLDRFNRHAPFSARQMLPPDLRRELPTSDDAGSLTVDDMATFVD